MEWISVKDEMPNPKIGESVHVLVSDGGQMFIEIYHASKISSYSGFLLESSVRNVTHWMPLPALPQEPQDA